MTDQRKYAGKLVTGKSNGEKNYKAEMLTKWIGRVE